MVGFLTRPQFSRLSMPGLPHSARALFAHQDYSAAEKYRLVFYDIMSARKTGSLAHFFDPDKIVVGFHYMNPSGPNVWTLAALHRHKLRDFREDGRFCSSANPEPD